MIKFNITQDSIDKSNAIIKNMEGKSFHNHFHILYDIIDSLNKDNVIYLEIGSYCGGSASLVSTNKKVSKVYSVDIGRPYTLKEFSIRNVNKFKHSNCVYEYFHGSSQSNDIISRVKSTVSEVDVLFIDGDHSYEAVIKDFNNYKDLVCKGGFIIFDDYHDKRSSPNVFRAVNNIVKSLSCNEYETIGSLKYDLLSKTNIPHFKSSNEFILMKK